MIKKYSLHRKNNSKKGLREQKKNIYQNKTKKYQNNGKYINNKPTANKKTIYNGGGCKLPKEKFEVMTLDNVDTSKFNVSQYVNANIDWGIMPGPPPTDCVIM
jgi:hypothetical protein